MVKGKESVECHYRISTNTNTHHHTNSPSKYVDAMQSVQDEDKDSNLDTAASVSIERHFIGGR